MTERGSAELWREIVRLTESSGRPEVRALRIPIFMML